MISYAPQISKMCQYACFKNNNAKSEYYQIYDSMVAAKMFSSAFNRAAPASTFNPTQHFTSMLPLFTIAFIHHVKITVTDNLEAHPILCLSPYCGAKKMNSNVTSDNLCFSRIPAVDGVRKDSMVTKMHDTALRSSGNPIQIYERDVLAHAILVWVDCTKLNGAEYLRLTDSKKYMGQKCIPKLPHDKC